MERPKQDDYWIRSIAFGDRFNAIEYVTDLNDYIDELEEQRAVLKKKLEQAHKENERLQSRIVEREKNGDKNV